MTAQPDETSPEGRPEVVILGAGFGGLAAAKALAKAPVHITIIDRQNHHLFQPLLYQVATAGVSPADVAVPIRSLFRKQANTTILMDTVVGIDTEAQTVQGHRAEHRYDYLIVATGSEYSYFGHDDWRPHAPSLKSLKNALDIREKVLLSFEYAETALDEAERKRLMTFVIVGGGATGVELAGALAELAKKALARDFRHIDPSEAEIVLLEAGPSVLHGFPESLTDFAERSLTKLGVTVRLNSPVESVDADGVTLADGQVIGSTNVLWAAGTRAPNVRDWLGAEADRQGRIKVGGSLTVPGHNTVFVIGDAACFAQEGGKPLPAVAPVAKQQGIYAAKAIARKIAGAQAHAPFRYRDAGMLATIGRHAAVANLHRFKMKGWFAWMFWGLIHIYFLIGARNRMMVFLNWVWAYFTYGLGARLITRSRVSPAEKEPEKNRPAA
ncbi:MAG: NAD(P)/FAD-dependent oxidoreductase [Pseudomonadota bacterium]